MVEVVFGDSACGSLKLAQSWGKGPYPGGACGVAFTGLNGRKPTRAELRAAQKEFNETQRMEWEAAVPLGGSTADVYGFELLLSVGDLSEAPPGPLRCRALQQLSVFPGAQPAAADLVRRANEALAAVLSRAAAGEAVRVWYSDAPDEACGLCWLMAQLHGLGGGRGPVSLVKLPAWHYNYRQDLVRQTGWGSVSPGEWGRYLALQTPALPAFIHCCALHWAELQRENAPLRAVINGRLVGVPASFYDPFIRRELAVAGETFQEAALIGRVLGKYELGVSDGWVALRVEELVRAGALRVVSEAPAGEPVYRRTLQKCAAL